MKRSPFRRFCNFEVTNGYVFLVAFIRKRKRARLIKDIVSCYHFYFYEIYYVYDTSMTFCLPNTFFCFNELENVADVYTGHNVSIIVVDSTILCI